MTIKIRSCQIFQMILLRKMPCVRLDDSLIMQPIAPLNKTTHQTSASARGSSIHYAKIFYFALLFALFLGYAIVYRGLWISPPNITADFVCDYTVGKIAQTDYSRIYNAEAQRQIQTAMFGEHWVPGGQFLFGGHPPYLVPVLKYVVSDDYKGSWLRWECALSIFWIINYWLLGLMLRSTNLRLHDIVVILLPLTFFYPVHVAIIKGQDSALLLLGVLSCAYAIRKKQYGWAGFALALATIKPHIALLLAFPFLWNRAKVWFGFCAGCLLLGVYSATLIGVQGIRDYCDIMRILAQGSDFGINQNVMFNFLGLLLRLFPHASHSLLTGVAWLFYFMALTFLCFLWRRTKDINLKHIGTAVLLSLIAAPHMHYHDLVLLLIPILDILMQNKQRTFQDPWKTGAWILLLTLGMAFLDLSPWRHVGIYVLIGGLGLWLWGDAFANSPHIQTFRWCWEIKFKHVLSSFLIRNKKRIAAPSKMGRG